MIDVRQAWRGHPGLVDLALATAAAALTMLVSMAQLSGLYVYPQLVQGTPASILNQLLPFGGLVVPEGILPLPLLAAAPLCLRRRHPAGVAVALIVLSAGAPLVVPVLVALFTVATRCSARITWRVTAAALVPVLLYLRRALPDPGVLTWATAVSAVTLVVGAVGWGLVVVGLRERAAHAEADAVMRAQKVRQHAREEIAREMHDVLAHRLSLLSMHAGALEYHPDPTPEQIAEAMGVIRKSATQALEDLQDVLKVLRAPVVSDHTEPVSDHTEPVRGPTEPPQPTRLDVDRLIEESRAAGADLTVRREFDDDPATMSPTTARTAYRLLQEALTNHRKHAPSAPVSLTVTGGSGAGLTIRTTNSLQLAPVGLVPGSGQGLIGMKERVDLAGGRLRHRVTHTDFHLDVWLPWTA